MDSDAPEDSAVLLAAALGSAAAVARLRGLLREFLAAEGEAIEQDVDRDGDRDLDGDVGQDVDRGLDRDVEQDVWVRMLEHLAAGGSPASPSRWLRRTAREVRAEAERDADRHCLPPRPQARRTTVPFEARTTRSAEQEVIDAELGRALRAAVPRLPGRCPRLVGALLDQPSATYRELAKELEISQGSIGPVRSRCLACLRRMLAAQGCTRP